MEKIRSFIAIELPGSTRKALEAVQNDIKSNHFRMRWVKPENIHLTLKFLGDITIEQVETVGRAMAAAAENLKPILLQAKGVGAFPNIKKPRVLWAGVQGDTEGLCNFQELLDRELSEIGIPPENRPFRGHLTIGRLKDWPDPGPWFAALERNRNFEAERFEATTVTLFRSDLTPAGARYSRLREAAFSNL